MRTAMERTHRHTPGGDLLVGVLATCLTIAVLLGAGTIAANRTMPLETAAIRGLGVVLATFISIPALVGIYARAGRDEVEPGVDDESTRIAGIPDGRIRETTRLTVDTLRHRGSTLVAGLCVALVASLLVGTLVTLVLHAVVLALLTLLGYVSYALGYGQLVSAVRMVHVSGSLVGLGLAIGVLSVRFFDCVVCWTDAGPVAAVRESLRFTRTRPLTVLGYALVTTVLFMIPSVATYLLATLHEPLAIGTFLIVTSASVAVYANVHARVCYRHLLPVCCGAPPSEQHSSGDQADSQSLSYTVRDQPLVANPVAIGLALLLVTALLVGSGSVRALDVRPVDTAEEPGPIGEFEDATALVDAGALPQTEANHRVVDTTYAYNETQDRWEKSVQFQYETDHQQSRHLVSFTTFDHNDMPTSSTTAYFSTKQFAMQWTDPQDPQPPSEPADRAWHERTAGNWTVYSVAGYEIIDQPSESINTAREFFDQEWEVVDESHDTITIAASGPDAVPVNEQGYGSIETADVEVTLDRETGYVVELSQELIREDDDLDPVRTHVEFTDWDDHAVDRPAEIDVKAVEWIWGVASY